MFMVWGLPWILQIFDLRDRICKGGHHGDYTHMTPGKGPGRGITQGTEKFDPKCRIRSSHPGDFKWRYRVGRWDHPSNCRHVTLVQGLGGCHPGACGHVTAGAGSGRWVTLEVCDM